MIPMATTSYTRRRFTIDEYHRMAENGIFGPDERMELIDGEIVSMSPMGSRHAAVIRRANTLLQKLISDTSKILQIQLPITLHGDSEPEPDLAVVNARDDFYEDEHPVAADVMLLIEVADTSLNYDTGAKQQLYAQNSIGEYWVIDLSSDAIIQYLNPNAGEYGQQTTCTRGDSFESPALGATISVNDCLGGK